ncbi:MAG: 3'(2'),5'-bisphosphate nucleotidase CysQ [Bacteroidia bacterium]|jgi:3'(2'), 5'-bisphosphate nucleotidase|nr:3'(2'),5'-bisphosphate nucleotidase CysQ [Bacteroidia bacterium]
MNYDPEYLFNLASHAAMEAGKVIMQIYETGFDVDYKADDSPLTQADRASDNIISKVLAETGIPILTEEDDANHPYEEYRSKWTQCWIVDPLDGTKEFVKRNGEFTVNIALCAGGLPVLGIVYAPAKGLFYYAAKGRGAWRWDITDIHAALPGFDAAMRLPLQPLPGVFTIAGSRSHSSPETEQFVKAQQARFGEVEFLPSGSSLKFCMVAEGRAHVYPRFAPTSEWDTAAGHIIALESGANVRTWPQGNELRYNRQNLLNPYFIVTAAEID